MSVLFGLSVDTPIWHCSDHHFFHVNIIKYSERPYFDMETMVSDIISKHNARVHPSDWVVFHGDIIMGVRDLEHFQILSSMNGRKILIRGNHDTNRTVKLALGVGFEEVHEEALYIPKKDLWYAHELLPGASC